MDFHGLSWTIMEDHGLSRTDIDDRLTYGWTLVLVKLLSRLKKKENTRFPYFYHINRRAKTSTEHCNGHFLPTRVHVFSGHVTQPLATRDSVLPGDHVDSLHAPGSSPCVPLLLGLLVLA